MNNVPMPPAAAIRAGSVALMPAITSVALVPIVCENTIEAIPFAGSFTPMMSK
ncbi:MAG TPA: hypothetical protein VGO54_13945 [Bradyrhizobium sp.]|jgi:hypothetical protein|nr:hypothetical protein [Bradyrhizobium sp.]